MKSNIRILIWLVHFFCQSEEYSLSHLQTYVASLSSNLHLIVCSYIDLGWRLQSLSPWDF